MQETAQPFEVALAVTAQGTFSPPIRQWPPALTVSTLPSSSNTSVATPSRSSASRSAIYGPWAAGILTTRRRVSTWHMAIRGSGAVNGVSRLHGQVSRRLFEPLPALAGGRSAHRTRDQRRAYADLGLGPGRRSVGGNLWQGPLAGDDGNPGAGHTPRLRRHALAIPHRRHKSLVEYARERLSRQLAASGASPEAVDEAKQVFDPNALTLGFPRRSRPTSGRTCSARPGAIASSVV